MATKFCACGCGRPTTSRQAKYAAECRAAGRQNQREATSRMNRERWQDWKAAGLDPTHGGEATGKRSAAIARSNHEKPRKAKR